MAGTDLIEADRLDNRPGSTVRLTFPITDLCVVHNDVYDRVLNDIEAATRRGGVYIHCWGGVGRTGMVVACLLARDGLGYGVVMARLRQARAGSRKSHRPCPETEAQRRFLVQRLGRSR